MKKLVITTALFAFASVSVFAQSSKTSMVAAPNAAANQPQQAAPMTSEQRSERLAVSQAKTFERQYKLNAEQYNGVHAACLDWAKKVEAIRASGKQGTREQMDAAMAEKNAKMKAAMSPEQYKAYEATLAHSAPQPMPTNVKKN